MRLISATLNGFRRFADASVNLDADVLAIVGPNEAGKTSLLEALASVKEEGPIDPQNFTRGLPNRPSGSDGVIRLRFLLDDSDSEILNDFPVVGSPRWFLVTKCANGRKTFKVSPDVTRDLTIRTSAREAIRRAIDYTHVRAILLESYPPFEDSDDGGHFPLIMVLDELRGKLDTQVDTLPRAPRDLLARVTEALDHAAAEFRDTKEGSYLKDLLTTLLKLKDHEAAPHPRREFLKELHDRQPQLYLYSEEERQLSSEYATEVLSGPIGPPALGNLFELAEVDSTALYESLEEGDHGRRAALEEDANATLQSKFEQAWSQSAVFPRLQFEQEIIRILVPTRDTYSPIAERSDGLRAFVALCAFTTLRGESTEPILLVDEAESHLHYDAQADLIGVFEQQDVASQIIYSTHSAGCLPNDLGRGIRVIQPTPRSEESDTGRSTINNSFWQEGAGFSPLMMAMGASVMAFVPTRRAVIAEGASETILLPTLLRKVGGLKRLPFQVAPGLASVPTEELEELELEAPKVAYLVDGDQSGDEYVERLSRAGVPSDLIHQLTDGAVLEDFIDTNLYIEAVNEELYRSHGEGVELKPDDLPEIGRPLAVRRVCEEKGVSEPSKVRVARQVVQKADSDLVVRDELAQELRGVLRELFECFGKNMSAFRQPSPEESDN